MTLEIRVLNPPTADKDAIKIGPASMIFRLFKRTGSTASTVEKRGRA